MSRHTHRYTGSRVAHGRQPSLSLRLVRTQAAAVCAYGGRVKLFHSNLAHSVSEVAGEDRASHSSLTMEFCARAPISYHAQSHPYCIQ
jgi:hypothetical protein